MKEIPERYDPRDAEARWREIWETSGIYRWDPSRPREESFVVDTPPLTVSGSLHVGHAFSFTHQDILVRFHRMRGRNIAYPMGWDDNGLPTERRVENLFKIRPNPRLPFDPQWKPRRDKGKKDPVEEVSRQNFIEACETITEEDEEAFEEIWRRLGLSVDWTQTYTTIDPHCRRLSQLSFLDLVRKGEVYQRLAPTMWDVDDQTAVAQAETEDRDRPGAYHDIRFGIEGGGSFVIATTRPELLGACIAVVAHPDDTRYQPLFGKRAIVPIFDISVPILPADHADPEKGTGILMVCTFGDQMDVEFWKQSGLGLKQLIGRDGRMMSVPYGEAPYESIDPEKARAAYGQIEGLSVNQARKKMAEILVEAGCLVGDDRPIQHPVKFYERGRRPLEFVPTRQWFVRILDHKDDLVAQGQKIDWHPGFMASRYENWVEGLNQDWCISRQRFFGVPFPIWYPVRDDGETDYENPIYASADSLPADPLTSTPPGFDEAQRDKSGGFTGDPDVMDTWATSSMTPQIISHWTLDPERHEKLFPMDVRPQSHEIIRTWAFYTIVKAWMHENTIPWKNVAISGWVLDPDRKKMSKSAGNVITPSDLLDQYSVDAIRYWAGRARLGVDTAADPKVFKIGRRLTTKLFNASRFVLMQLDRVGPGAYSLPPTEIQEPLDRAYVARLGPLVERATEAFERFEYASALQATEEAFWTFCDDLVELVKVRSYDESDSAPRRSAHAALGLALRTFLRLFAPVLPYVTEEVWSWRFAGEGRTSSIHTAPWPEAEEFADVSAPEGVDPFACAVEVVRKVRTAKTQAKRSLRWPVIGLEITGPDENRNALEPVLSDVLQTGNVDDGHVQLSPGPAPESELFTVDVALSEG
jgi:valyl-tRNA synthetase